MLPGNALLLHHLTPACLPQPASVAHPQLTASGIDRQPSAGKASSAPHTASASNIPTATKRFASMVHRPVANILFGTARLERGSSSKGRQDTTDQQATAHVLSSTPGSLIRRAMLASPKQLDFANQAEDKRPARCALGLSPTVHGPDVISRFQHGFDDLDDRMQSGWLTVVCALPRRTWLYMYAHGSSGRHSAPAGGGHSWALAGPGYAVPACSPGRGG